MGRLMAYSPSPSPSPAPHSPHIAALRSAAIAEQEKYLNDLISERNKIHPLLPVLSHSYRLLNQEIMRVTQLLGNALIEPGSIDHARALVSRALYINGGADVNSWTPPPVQSEMSPMLQQSPGRNWLGPHGNSSGLLVKRTIRIDIPVDQYPTFNFVGRLLGPRGNSLKRVEASTDCRVLIRGRGSIKDPFKEDMMRGKPGYEHLNEPLHILIEAELPMEFIDTRLMQAREIIEELLKPVDECNDLFKRQQLRELAMLKGNLHDDVSLMSGPVSPLTDILGMKRAKLRG